MRAEAFNPKTLFLVGSKGLSQCSLCLAMAHQLDRKVLKLEPALALLRPAKGFCQHLGVARARVPAKQLRDARSPSEQLYVSKTRRRMSVGLNRLLVQLYVSKTKRKTAAALQLAPKLQELLTQDHLAASLHAVHLRDTTLKRMHRILRHYRRRYSTLVAFVPSGRTGDLPVHLPKLICA